MRAGGHYSDFILVWRVHFLWSLVTKNSQDCVHHASGTWGCHEELLGSTSSLTMELCSDCCRWLGQIPTFGHMVTPPLDYALYCKDNRRRLWNLKFFGKIDKSMRAVTINCKFSLPHLNSSGMQQQQPGTVTHSCICSLLISRRLTRPGVASRYSVWVFTWWEVGVATP